LKVLEVRNKYLFISKDKITSLSLTRYFLETSSLEFRTRNIELPYAQDVSAELEII